MGPLALAICIDDRCEALMTLIHQDTTGAIKVAFDFR